MSEIQHECDVPIYFQAGSWWLNLRGGRQYPVTYCPDCGVKLYEFASRAAELFDQLRIAMDADEYSDQRRISEELRKLFWHRGLTS